MLVQAAASVRDELLVRDAERAARIQATDDDGPPLAAYTKPLDRIPARAALFFALVRAREAARAPAPERRKLLAAAEAALHRALGARPDWGAAWVVATYVAVVRHGAASPVVRDAFRRSYETGPFQQEAAAWRIGYGADQWAELDRATRGRLIEEAVWLSGMTPVARAQVSLRLAGTPAYAEYEARRAAVS